MCNVFNSLMVGKQVQWEYEFLVFSSAECCPRDFHQFGRVPNRLLYCATTSSHDLISDEPRAIISYGTQHLVLFKN